MKLSWSHKLFILVNQWAGQSRAYDLLVRFWAEYAIFVLAISVVGWLVTQAFILTVVRLGLAWVIGLGVSWLFGWAWSHPRPKIELPETREIIVPMSHWKSLPSDHAFTAWLLVFVAAAALVWSENGWFLAGIVVGASGISVARVLAGVHYPRDILAGAGLAGVVAWVFFG